MSASNTPSLDSEKTEVLYGFNKTTEVIMKFLNSSEVSMNICADYTWPSVAMGVEVFRKGLYELKTRSVLSLPHYMEPNPNSTLYSAEEADLDKWK
ncbi:MAG: hypothetical protein WAU25_13250 [Nitrososphaeraceae archaeon]